MFEAVLEEELRHGLQHADAPIVAEEAQIVDQLLRRIEHRIVHLARHEAHPGGLRKRQIDAVVREGKGQRLSEIAVRRIAEQSRTGEASGFYGGHGEWGIGISRVEVEKREDRNPRSLICFMTCPILRHLRSVFLERLAKGTF